MAQAITAANAIAKVRWRADAVNLALRHTDADLLVEFNASWRGLRRKASDAGSGLYLKWSTPATMTAGVLAGHSFGTISLPSDLVMLYAIDVTMPEGSVISLQPSTMQERNSYRDQWNRPTGRPQYFFVYNIGTETTTTVTAGTAGIIPAPDSAYSYTLCYLPVWADITNTTYVFDSYDGWDEWAVWDTVVKIAARDNDMQQTAAIAVAEREKVWLERILRDCAVQKVGPVRRVDTAMQARQQQVALIRRFP